MTMNDMGDKTYVGRRAEGAGAEGVEVFVAEYGYTRPLPSRLDLREHSVNLEWAYGIGGPAQLALAILADATGNDDYAQRHYHWFKLEVVSRLPWRGWELTAVSVHEWIERHHPLPDG